MRGMLRRLGLETAPDGLQAADWFLKIPSVLGFPGRRILVAGLFNATGGKAIGTYDLTTLEGKEISLPSGVIVFDSLVHVVTTFTSAGSDAGTIALKVQTANDIVSAIAISNEGNPWDAGLHAGVPVGSAATGIVLTAARTPQAVVAGQALTAGVARVYLDCIFPPGT